MLARTPVPGSLSKMRPGRNKEVYQIINAVEKRNGAPKGLISQVFT
jgi:hypothetical protein